MNINKTYAMLVLTTTLWANIPNVAADIKTDTETILNWTEQAFPTVLPTHQPTQEFNNWLYREYLSTDLYTGINTLDNGVYYIYGKDLASGKAPVFYKSTSALLGEITGNGVPNGNKVKACDVSKMPAGHQITQNGNTVKVSTNGCIPEPLETPDYCPPKAGTISFLSRMNVTTTTGTDAKPNVITFCTMNASPESIGATIELDVCYIDDAKPPVSTKTQGKMEFEQVADCLKTNADYVTDVVNDRFWVNTENGFLELNTSKLNP